jgi:hypothetical protein
LKRTQQKAVADAVPLPQSLGVIQMGINKKHINYLILGIVFWGLLIGGIIKIFFWPEITLVEIEIIYIVLTAFITLLMQWYAGGFYIRTPKNWFYIPLGSWAIVLIWVKVETFIAGGNSFLPF